MSGDDCTYASAIARQAEHELMIYLGAVNECLGFRDPLSSGHVWIDVLESLEWPTLEHEKFFRRVTVLAILRLLRRPADTTVSAARMSACLCVKVKILEQ